MREAFDAIAIGTFIPLAISFVLFTLEIVLLRKLVRAQRELIDAQLERIRELEHLEHDPRAISLRNIREFNAGSPVLINEFGAPTYWGRDLRTDPLPSRKKH